MNRANIIRELRASKLLLLAQCPNCEKEFALAKAFIFDASGDLPDEAAEYLENKENDLRQRKDTVKQSQIKLEARKQSATVGAEKKAKEVGLGMALEKLVLMRPAFPYDPHDCRSLQDPIDYVAFDGMAATETVKEIGFIDVKTGGANLNTHQRMIRDAVKDGRVDYQEV